MLKDSILNSMTREELKCYIRSSERLNVLLRDLNDSKDEVIKAHESLRGMTKFMDDRDKCYEYNLFKFEKLEDIFKEKYQTPLAIDPNHEPFKSDFPEEEATKENE